MTNGSDIVVEDFPFTWNGYNYVSHIAFQRGAAAKPLILIFPNYAGEKQFDIDQAVFLARCGYTACSVDMYQETPYENGVSYPKSNRNPLKTDSREKIMAHFKGAFTAYNWFQLHPKEWRDFQSKFFAAVRKHPAAHFKFAAAIGYCFHVRVQIRLLAQIRVALELEHRLGCILGARGTSCVDSMVLAGLYLRQVVVLVEAFLAPKRHLRLLLRARSVRLHCGSRLQLQRLRHLGGRSCCLSTLCGRDDYLHAAVELEADRVCVHRRRYQPLSCVTTRRHV